MHTRRPVIIALLLALAGGIAFSQSIIGPMYKLGSSTTANLPASSSLTTGALIYDLDAGVPKYNNGSSWLEMGGGGGDSLWSVATTDAGVLNRISSGYSLQSADAGALLVGTTGTGAYSPLAAFSGQPGGNSWASIAFMTNQGSADPFVLGNVGGYQSGNGIQVCAQSTASGQINLRTAAVDCHNPAGGYIWNFDRFGRLNAPNPGTIRFPSTPSGTNAIEVSTNGARVDFGAGTDDYAASDGTGVRTPSYWLSTRAFNTTGTAGLQALSHGFPNTLTNLNYEPADNLPGNYALSFNNTMRTLVETNSTTGLGPQTAPVASRPLSPALEHAVHGRGHTTSMDIGFESTSCPAVRERIGYNGSTGDYATNFITGWCDTNASSSTVLSGMRAFEFVTNGTINDTAGWWTTDETSAAGATSTPRPVTSPALQGRLCSRVRIPSGFVGRVIVGFFNGLPPVGLEPASTPGIWWRYDSATSTQWFMCSANGISSTCQWTSVTMTATTPVELCIDYGASAGAGTGAGMWLNGRYYGLINTAVPSSTTPLTPVVRAEATTATTQSFAVHSLSVESW